jgi:Ca2+-binding RTX toxin-like protein
MGTFVSISGGGNANVHIYGNGSVAAGNGNDTIQISGNGNITVGSGHDVLGIGGSGYILQNGHNGNDTINLGSGNDSITEAGTATVHGAFGNATISGGKFQFLDLKGDGSMSGGCSGTSQNVYEQFAINGKATLVGGSNATNFVAGSGSVVMQGGSGNDTFTGGSGQATMTGGSGHNLFYIGCHAGAGGTDVITNFVSGQDQLYLANDSYSWLASHGDITVSHGNTYIQLDGGQTVVELKGFTGLTSGDVTTHKG